jgi:TPR repeat protein
MNALGLMYIDGEGVAQDCTIGKKWLDKAVAAGNWMAEINRRAAAARCHW